MNYLALSQLNEKFNQFCKEKSREEILDDHIQDSVLQSQLPVLKYKYKCRSLGCRNTIKSEVALSRDCHFCVHCIDKIK